MSSGKCNFSAAKMAAYTKKKNHQATVKKIMSKFQVSEACASYMYYRAYRSKHKDNKYLPWSVNLQNALIKADSAYGFDWEALQFGHEHDTLLKYGIDVENTQYEEDEKKSEWQVVSSTGRNDLIKRCGIILIQ